MLEKQVPGLANEEEMKGERPVGAARTGGGPSRAGSGEPPEAQTGREAGSGHQRESGWEVGGTRAWLSGLRVLAPHPCGVTALLSRLHGAEKKRVCYHDVDTCFYS